MDNQQGFPVLRECYGCGWLFSNNHRCPATNERCSQCNQYGHYSGFCLKWKCRPLAITQNDTDTNRDSMTNNQIISRDFFNAVSTYNHICKSETPAVTAACEQSSSCNTSNGEPQYSRDGGSMSESNIEKDRANTLQEKNDMLQKKLDESKSKIKALHDSIDYEMKTVTILRKKLDVSKRGLETEKRENDRALHKFKMEAYRMRKQRDKMFMYAMKVVHYATKARRGLGDCIKEHRYTMDHVYRSLDSRAPPWILGPCQGCGSSARHMLEDCLARGNVCHVCRNAKHFTALCLSDSLTFSISPEEALLLDCVEREIWNGASNE